MAANQTGGLRSVVIVGAGPSGLLLALALAALDPRPEITVLDAATSRNLSPRATHYGAPAIQFFRKLGILARFRQDGYVPENTCWRKLDGTKITGISLLGGKNGKELDGDAVTVFPVEDMCDLLERELRSRADVSVQWGSKVVGLRQGLNAGDAAAAVEVVNTEGTKLITADYVVGTDGGTSTIRRLMFGQRNFPGFSWDQQVVATNTEYDFDQFGWEDANFIIHPVHWYMAARIGPHADPKKNVWRISYGELSGLSDDELAARLPMKFEQMLPGNPKPDQYRVLNRSPYKVHQRCCESMRMNRVLLAADAAHLCNPFGGLGLTGGIVDIAGLSQCFEGMHKGLADQSILTTWSNMQMKKWHEIINPVSTGNIRRLFQLDPDRALEQDELLRMMKESENDAELSRQIQGGAYELLHDYTRYFGPHVSGNLVVSKL